MEGKRRESGSKGTFGPIEIGRTKQVGEGTYERSENLRAGWIQRQANENSRVHRRSWAKSDREREGERASEGDRGRERELCVVVFVV